MAETCPRLSLWEIIILWFALGIQGMLFESNAVQIVICVMIRV